MPAPLPPSSPSAAPGEGRDAGVPLLLVRGLSKSFGPTRALRRAKKKEIKKNKNKKKNKEKEKK
jgi:hypothetical protein